jgi:hypothetical protein
MIIKAISLWEPWASLIRDGLKRYETRHWKTNYRGQLLICAAARKPDNETLFSLAVYVPQGISVNCDQAVALVDLVDCIPTETMTAEQIGTDAPFGNFSPGRFVWKLENIRAIKSFPVTGRQGLFNIEINGNLI